jgi:hypothetical protein
MDQFSSSTSFSFCDDDGFHPQQHALLSLHLDLYPRLFCHHHKVHLYLNQHPNSVPDRLSRENQQTHHLIHVTFGHHLHFTHQN